MNSNGSGGELFNTEGKVIGISFAMVREFGEFHHFCWLREVTSETLKPASRETVGVYLKLGFGGAHIDSNQRLIYTSA
jgi:S1-C subfamily serine protease